jgi:hypothetical protein
MGAGLTVLNLAGAASTPEDVDEAVDAITDFWTALAPTLPAGLTLQVNNVVEVREEDSGSLISVYGAPAQAAVASSGPGSHAAGVGFRIRWSTAGIRNGRAVTGTTFVVPLPTTLYETNGTIAASMITASSTAAAALLGRLNAAGLPLGVWSRPSAPGANDGVLHPVTQVVIPDQVSWLRTRRH